MESESDCPTILYATGTSGHAATDPRCTEPRYVGPPVTQGVGDAQIVADLINKNLGGGGRGAFGDDPEAVCQVNPYPKSSEKGAAFYCKVRINTMNDSSWSYGPVKYPDGAMATWTWVPPSPGEPGGAGNECPCDEMTPGQGSSSTAPGDGGQSAGFDPYVGLWIRHTSNLEITEDQTGKMLLGSGCCNSISFPLSFALGGEGILLGTVSGAAEYSGESFKSLIVPEGEVLQFRFGPGEDGPVLLSTNPNADEPGVDDEIVWCNESAYDYRCGA